MIFGIRITGLVGIKRHSGAGGVFHEGAGGAPVGMLAVGLALKEVGHLGDLPQSAREGGPAR